MIRTILIPLDGSELGERALPVAVELAKALRASLALVCVAGAAALESRLTAADRQAVELQYKDVTEENHLLSTDPRKAERVQGQVRAVAEAESYLAAVATRLASEGITAQIAVPYGRAADGILMEIRLRSADLVVMSTHGRSGLREVLAGSVAQAVVARSPVPVLLVPPERI